MLDYFISRFNSFSLKTNGLTPENLLSRSKKEFSHSPGSDYLIICLPPWGQKISEWKEIKKWARKSGNSFLVYQFPFEILSNDYILTEKIFKQINEIVRKDITELKNKHEFKKCILVGISLSSSYGSMIYKDNSDITDIVLVCPGNNLAVNMWNGCRTQHLRKSYEKQGFTLPQLKEYWRDLASENNMPALGTKILILYGKFDQVIIYSESKILGEVLKANMFNVNVKNYKCGHYILILGFLLWPRKILNKISN